MSNVFSFEPPARHATAPSKQQAESALLQSVAVNHDILIASVEDAALRLRDSMSVRANARSASALAELSRRYQQYIAELKELRPLIEQTLAD